MLAGELEVLEHVVALVPDRLEERFQQNFVILKKRVVKLPLFSRTLTQKKQ